MEYIPVTMIRADLEGLPLLSASRRLPDPALPTGRRAPLGRGGERGGRVRILSGRSRASWRSLVGPLRRWKSVASSWRRTPGV